MKMGHVAWESSGLYGGASLAFCRGAGCFLVIGQQLERGCEREAWKRKVGDDGAERGNWGQTSSAFSGKLTMNHTFFYSGYHFHWMSEMIYLSVFHLCC